MSNALVSIQILPKTPQNDDVIPYVDRAIEIIQKAGVPYRVGPLETTMEGDLDTLLIVVKEMNEGMIEAGCPYVISQIKILYDPKGTSMQRLTKKYD